jgi:hypothetical protein
MNEKTASSLKGEEGEEEEEKEEKNEKFSLCLT